MGISCAPDIFQDRMSSLVAHLEFAWVYMDDLLVLTNGSFEDHLGKLGKVLALLQKAGLKCNAEKSFFCAEQVEYLGYLLAREGIKPLPNKVKVILAILLSKNICEV